MSKTKYTTHEERRLAQQAALDAKKTTSERNRMGQFATPTALAREILDYSVNLLPKQARIRFLDPALGTGSFYSALLNVTGPVRIALAQGFEIDEHYGLPARKLWADAPLMVHVKDFTKAMPPANEAGRFNLVVCNPPYVRHHHIVNGDKLRLQEATERACGVRIGGLAGLYCHFLGLTHAWMTDDGIAAWLIPSEFMDVNYGEAVKQYLINNVTLLRIHRFDPNDVQFDDALVSSAVVWFRKAKPPTPHRVEFTFGGTIAEPKLQRVVAAEALRKEAKWTRFPVHDVRSATKGTTLADFFTIKRGLATGDNAFFILPKEDIEQRGLPMECFRPILPSPRYLSQDEVRADKAGNPDTVPQLFVLDCRLPEDKLKAQYPTLWRYLDSGKPHVAKRYLCAHRKPWYSQEDRPPAPFVCTYLGRSDTKSGRPFRFILNHSHATAANVYIMLYPKQMLADQLSRHPHLYRKVWKILNQIRPERLLEEGRVYGGGLHKLEPKELGAVSAEPLLALFKTTVLPSLKLELAGA